MPFRKRSATREDDAAASAEGPVEGAAAHPGAGAARPPAPGAGDAAPATPAPPAPPTTTADPPAGRRPLGQLGPVLLLRAAHPRQAVLTALGVAAAAALADRPARELLLVLGTVLVGQTMVGWHHDLVDRRRDRQEEVAGKPLAAGTLDPGNVWFALACAGLLVVPLALSAGLVAGSAYLVSVAVALLGNVALRRSWLSWLPWAASYGLYPAYLSYGGWGGGHRGDPPEIAVTLLAAALGVCVHFLRALPGLVADNRHGRRHLPLRVALRIGAPALLWASLVATAAVLAALAVAGSRVGLAQ